MYIYKCKYVQRTSKFDWKSVSQDPLIESIPVILVISHSTTFFY